jgi:uncharacterized protein (TIGR02996 family)
MNDDAAFIQGILDNPEDDALRLVYADWLEDHDQSARAELIRVQIELAGMEKEAPDRARLDARQEKLLEAHGREWAGPFPRLVNEWEFERGFISEIVVQVRGFLKHAETLFRLAPIRTVRLRMSSTAEGEEGEPEEEEEEDESPAELMPALAQCPFLARLTSVDLSWLRFTIAGAGLKEFLSSPYLKGIRELTFMDEDATPEMARILADCPNLPGLKELLFEGDYYGFLGDEGLEILARSRYLTGLTCLALGQSEIEEAGVQALAASRNFRQLEILDLLNNQIGPEGARALAGSRHLGRLRQLSLGGGEIGDDGLEALADSSRLRGLQELDIRDNKIGDRGLRALAGSTLASQLTSLWLGDKSITDKGIQALAAAPRLDGLTDLRIWDYEGGNAGLRALADSPHLANLKTLLVSPLGRSRQILSKRFGKRLLKDD